jgi:hypothetical protein
MHQVHAVMLPSQVVVDHVAFHERQMNNVMNRAWFTRTVLTGPLLTTIGVNMLVSFLPLVLTPCYNNANKLAVGIRPDAAQQDVLKLREREILEKYRLHHGASPLSKRMRTTLADNLDRRFVVVVKETCAGVAEAVASKELVEFVVNMSGVWENDTEYGITFKIVAVKRSLGSCSARARSPSSPPGLS